MCGCHGIHSTYAALCATVNVRAGENGQKQRVERGELGLRISTLTY